MAIAFLLFILIAIALSFPAFFLIAAGILTVLADVLLKIGVSAIAIIILYS